jgi:hypothetical protein
MLRSSFESLWKSYERISAWNYLSLNCVERSLGVMPTHSLLAFGIVTPRAFASFVICTRSMLAAEMSQIMSETLLKSLLILRSLYFFVRGGRITMLHFFATRRWSLALLGLAHRGGLVIRRFGSLGGTGLLEGDFRARSRG